MRILMINVTCGSGSTGRICTDLADALEKQGHEVKIAYGRNAVPEKDQKYAIRIGNDLDVNLHGVKARLLDGMGLGSQKVTERFVDWVKEFNPDVIHLHNIHGYYLNVEVLFQYLKQCGKKVIWTLHDCWAFTGHCAYFDYVGCDKWKSQCHHCNQKTEYPSRIGIDCSKRNYTFKKELFTGIKDFTLVTPSQWLADLVKESFLKEYPVQVIHNGINTMVFQPTASDIKQRYHITSEKKVVLGVASVWDKRKGLADLIQLSELLDEHYKMVLIGLNPQQLEQLPSQIIGIQRTENVQELVAWYSAAEVLVNPTYEDNYPTTNLEAIACGTPVISYDTGGSGESATIYGCTTSDKTPESILKALKQGFVKKEVDLSSEKMLSQYLTLLTK